VIKLTNREWKDLISKQFDVSKTTANDMLSAMLRVKKYKAEKGKKEVVLLEGNKRNVR
jgi:hypothetical protein